MTCLRAGKHVLMEKPMVVSEDQGVELTREAARRELTLMVAYPMRFHPLVVHLKDLLDKRLLGEPSHLSIFPNS